jgi:hypothetical protein
MKAIRNQRRAFWGGAALALLHTAVLAGPYSAARNDPANIFDAPVPGFVGPDGEGKARLSDSFGGFINPRNFVNPIFFGWGTLSTGYVRADGETAYNDPDLALGPVSGDNFDVVALGDLTAQQIGAGAPVGQITLQMIGGGAGSIRDLPGADFVVFENGVIAQFGTGGAGPGGIFGELAYVEVSSNGVDFARFPSVSLTPSAVGGYGSIDATNLFNLAGKHANADGESWGTPFDLAALANHPLVLAGTVDLNLVSYVRLVDIPGNGSFLDASARPIYDAWVTIGSGGFDLEAVGAISTPILFEEWQSHNGLSGDQRGLTADPDRDGVANLLEFAFAMHPLRSDRELLPVPQQTSEGFAISFRRDTRVVDAVVEVLGSDDMDGPWQVVARSQLGGPILPVAPFTPAIEDTSASSNANVGVVRRQSVTAGPGHRLLRIRVSYIENF